MSDSQITRDNHYVPRAVLKRWSQDGTHVFAYQTLVPHADMPLWQRRAIRGVASQGDLYSSSTGTAEVDTFERWITKEFEQPGLRAIGKLLGGSRLRRDDWRDLTRFLAAQDVRTPRSFVDAIQRWEREMPALLENTLAEAVHAAEAARKAGKRIEAEQEPNELAASFQVRAERDPTAGARIVAEVTLGRRLWLASIRHVLNGVARELLEHQWTLMHAHGDLEFPMTDQPVLRLNFNSPKEYNFGGGWGRRGSDIIMPLSPRHVLHTQVGKTKNVEREMALDAEKTRLIQRLLAERAFRWVFATKPLDWVEDVRPRIVSEDQWKAEQEAWRRWGQDQARAELATR